MLKFAEAFPAQKPKPKESIISMIIIIIIISSIMVSIIIIINVSIIVMNTPLDVAGCKASPQASLGGNILCMCVYIYIYIHRDIIAHRKSTPQKSSRIFSGILQWTFSGIFNEISLSSTTFQRIVTSQWIFTGSRQWHFPMEFNICDFWCINRSLSLSLSISLSLYIYIYVYIHTYKHLPFSLSLYIYIYVCMYIHVYIYIYMYTEKERERERERDLLPWKESPWSTATKEAIQAAEAWKDERGDHLAVS